MDLKAYHFTKRLLIKSINVSDLFSVKFHSPLELALEIAPQKYIFVFNFGSIICFNLNTDELDRYVSILCNRLGLDRNNYKFDDIQIEENPQLESSHKIEFSKILLKEISYDAIRIIALLEGESVALDYHQATTTDLLNKTKDITDELRDLGRSTRSHKNLVKYVGMCLSTKHSIIDDLYIFDEPDETWDDQRLSKLWEDLRRYLELQSRFKSIEYDLDLIQDATEVIADIVNARNQNRLEITIILLIAFEILKSFF